MGRKLSYKGEKKVIIHEEKVFEKSLERERERAQKRV